MPTHSTRNGLRLAYRDVGHGPVAVFLHPFPLDSRAWERQIAALAAEQRVLAIDFPGFGESGPPPSGLTLGAVADGIVELLQSLSVATAAFVGLSMGGYLLLELLSRAPDLASRLLLADTRAGPDSPEGAAGRERFAARAEREGVAWVAGEMIPRLLRPNPEPEVRRAVAHLIDQATPAGVAAAQRAMATRADHRRTLESLRMPALVLAGSQDALTPPDESIRMAESLPDARLEILPGAGHLSNLDAPDAFTRALVSFVTR